MADRRFAWGEAAARDGDFAAAADLFAQTLELAPDWAPGWLALGEARQQLGDLPAAREAFACADMLDPSGELGVGLRLAALGVGQSPATAPAAYVRDLFDQYAARFDSHLVGALAYRGPDILREAVARACRALGRPVRFNAMLDLGCGTGLAARAFAPSRHGARAAASARCAVSRRDARPLESVNGAQHAVWAGAVAKRDHFSVG